MNFPPNFDVRIPITYVGQEIIDDKVVYSFDLKGFNAIGFDDPCIKIPFNKEHLNRAKPAIIVMVVRQKVLSVVAQGLGLSSVLQEGLEGD